jgi:hypothetical protein
MRQVVAIILLLVSSSASAQVVHKCVAKGKPVSYQSEPCAAGAKTSKVVAAPRDTRPPPVYAAAPAASHINNVEMIYNNVPVWTEADQRRANCEAAKQRRITRLERLGLRRTYDDLQQLDAGVAQACKGV